MKALLLIGAIVGGLLVSAGAYFRTQAITTYYMSLIRDVDRLTRAQIQRDDYDWQWRYDELAKVTVNDMMLKFWRPLPSFWTDHAFHTADRRPKA